MRLPWARRLIRGTPPGYADRMPFVDLHLHSNHSDGSDAPEQIAERACQAGAAAIAITDHDTVAGVAAGRQAAERRGLGYLAGVEISACFTYREVHILGLGIDETDSALCTGLAGLCVARQNRSGEILARLNELGFALPDFAADPEIVGHAAGRMHIAEAMTAAGYVKKPQEAFDRYLNAGKPAFVPKETMPLAEAIDLIHGAGGLAFVAHPGLGKWVRKALPRLLEFPFDGIEAYHVSHTPGRVEAFIGIARERGLLITGGSDCHGTIKGKALLGTVHTPESVYTDICAALHPPLHA